MASDGLAALIPTDFLGYRGFKRSGDTGSSGFDCFFKYSMGV